MTDLEDAVSVCKRILRENRCQNLARLVPDTADWNRIETLKTLIRLRPVPVEVKDAIEAVADAVRERYGR